MKNSKILIVGGLGYLGSKLSSDILIYNKKIELSIIDILDTSNFQIYKSLVSLGLKNYFNININFKNLLEEHFKKNYYNIVINLASIVGAPLCDLYKNEAIILNQNSAINLAKIIDKNTRYIFASTGSCYGKIGTYCDENVKIKPVSIYAKTKANVEKKIKSRKNTTILRFTTVFGISIKTRDDLLINSFVKRSLRDKSIVIYEPNAKRNFISIDEISTTIIKLIKLKISTEFIMLEIHILIFLNYRLLK